MPFGPGKGHSNNLRPQQAREIRQAWEFAEWLDRQLTACIDINWTRTSAGDDHDGHLLRAVLKDLRGWLAGRRLDLYAIWFRENPERKGPNSHVMLHLPEGQLLRDLKHYGSALLPHGCQDCDGRAVYIHPAGSTRHARASRFLYLSKGVRPGRIAESLGIRPQGQGRVFGKRCGTTENLGPAARRRYYLSVTAKTAAPPPVLASARAA